MKKRLGLILFVLTMLASASSTFAQGFVAILCSFEIPITRSCDGGDPIPDGVDVRIYWDANNNGPDPSDVQPDTGECFLCANFNTLQMNGEELLGTPGTFCTDPAFTIFTGMPESPRYYIRVHDCVGEVLWTSEVLTMIVGLQDVNYSQWTCVQQPCTTGGECDPPTAPVGLGASSTFCDNILLSWTAYTDAEAEYLKLYRDGTPLTLLPTTQTGYSDVTTGSHSYSLTALNVCAAGDTAESDASTAAGSTRSDSPPAAVTGFFATDTECGEINLNWTAYSDPGNGDWLQLRRDGGLVANLLNNVTSYVDPVGGTHSYEIRAVKVCAPGDSIFSSPATDQGTSIGAPAAVEGLTASNNLCDAIQLNWTGYAGTADLICIARDFIAIAFVSTAATSYLDEGATGSHTYDLKAIVVCAPGDTLESGGAFADGSLSAPPAAVSNFAASSNLCDRVRLTWTAYSSPDVSLLRITRGVTVIATVPSIATQYDDTGLFNATYSIVALKVCAPGDTVLSAASSDPGQTAQPPVAPSQMSASDTGCDSVTVLFTFNNVQNQDSVFVKRDGDIIAHLGPSVANVQRTYVDHDAPLGASTYEVCPSSNACGMGACAGDEGFTRQPPQQVICLTASQNLCASIALTWCQVPGATGYQIRRNGSLIGTISGDLVAFTDNTLPPGLCYNYTVTAVNECGPGQGSIPVQGCRLPLPLAPTNLNATDGLCNEVVITWNEVATADSYQVRRNNNRIGATLAGVLSFTDLAVTPGTTYTYTVVAYNFCGASPVPPGTTGFSAQAAPTVANVTATDDVNDRVLVQWGDVAQESGYDILRSDAGNVPVYAVIGTVGSNVTNFNDFSAAPGQEYLYRVRAFNGCGVGAESLPAIGVRAVVNPIVFGQVYVTDELNGVMSAKPADLDNDGDMDVVACGMFADQVVWYENIGAWNFAPHVLIDRWQGARSVVVGDIDDDGDLDIAAVAQFADQLIWWQKTPAGYTRRDVSSSVNGASDILIVDLDDDGDKDFVTAEADGNSISWWSNNGSETFTRNVVTSTFAGARSVEVYREAGAWHILGAAYEGGEFAEWHNNGSEVFTKTTLGFYEGASYIAFAQLGAPYGAGFYFCASQAPYVGFWNLDTHELLYITDLLAFPREMDAEDVDGDGNRDLLLASNADPEVSWWRNTDNRFYRNVVSNTLIQGAVVEGVDADGDGDMDILAAGETSVRFYLSTLNDGDGSTELLIPREPDDEGDVPTLSTPSLNPATYELLPNYPNPFNPSTNIRFALPEAGDVQLVVYDVTGREVARLADGMFDAGYHSVTFDARANASGVYLYRLTAGSFVETRKMVLMK